MTQHTDVQHPMMTIATERVRHVFLLRHGETDWNAEWRIQSHEPIPLNAVGRAQAQWAGEQLVAALTSHPTWDAEVWSSPVARAHETATIVREAIAEAGRVRGEVHFHDALGEFDMGEFTGRTLTELRRDPRWQAYVQAPEGAVFPGGESMHAIWTRAEAGLTDVLAGSTSAAVVVVSHGGIVRALTLSLLGMPRAQFHRLRIANGSITHVRFAPPDRHRVLCVNHAQTLAALH